MQSFADVHNMHVINMYTLGRTCLQRTSLPGGMYRFAKGYKHRKGVAEISIPALATPQNLHQ